MKKIATNNELTKYLIDKEVLIFDFDGTIADTETLHWSAYNELLKSYGVKLTNFYISKYIGNDEKSIYKMIKEDFNIEFNEDAFLKARLDIYMQLVNDNNLKPYPIIENIILNHSSKKYVLSSQKKHIIVSLLQRWGIYGQFKYIFSVADDNISKHDVLSSIKNIFNTDNCRAVLFEDSNKYLKMAIENDVFAIGVENKFNNVTNCDILIEV